MRVVFLRLGGVGQLYGEFRRDPSAASRARLTLQLAAKPLHALFHTEEAHAAHALWIKALTIVRDFDFKPFGALSHRNARVLSRGVSCSVIERFLDEAVDANLDRKSVV